MKWISSLNQPREATCIDILNCEAPRKLLESAGGSSCCIFRVSDRLVVRHREAYLPQIVSIGPYHHGSPETQMMEEHKPRYLKSFLSRCRAGQVDSVCEDLFEELAKKEAYLKEFYSEDILLGRDKFTKMLLLDGCFIVELLLRKHILDKFKDKEADEVGDDPIFKCPWILPLILRDLIKLENQIPLFVLQQIYGHLNEVADKKIAFPSLSALAFGFSSSTIKRPAGVIERYESIFCAHLLDLYRDSFTSQEMARPRTYRSAKVIQCATRLRKAGINFKPVNKTDTDSFLDISFENGVLKIPPFTIGDFHATFLKNCVAYEQNYEAISNNFTAYVAFMGRVIDTENDVGLLIDEKIMYNFLGTEREVARFFNDIGCHVIIDIQRCYLSSTILQVHNYYEKTWHVRWAEFKSIYFGSPWTFLSAGTALLLLLLTVAQTIFAILGLGDYRIKM